MAGLKPHLPDLDARLLHHQLAHGLGPDAVADGPPVDETVDIIVGGYQLDLGPEAIVDLGQAGVDLGSFGTEKGGRRGKRRLLTTVPPSF